MERIEIDVKTGAVKRIELTAEEIAALPAPTPEISPPFVWRAQAKMWLHRAGKLTAVQSFVDASEDMELKIWWNEATTFRKDHPYIVALAGRFEIDIEQAFLEASKI